MKEKLIYLVATFAVVVVVVIFLSLNRKGDGPREAVATEAPSDDGRVVQAIQPASALANPSASELEAPALAEALAKGTPLVLVDVREPSEFAEGHLKGAKNIPLGELEARVGEIPKDQDVVLICRSGRRSLTAFEKLKAMGYSRQRNFKGGMLTWTGETEK